MFKICHPIIMSVIHISQFFISCYCWFRRDFFKGMVLEELKKADIKVNTKDGNPWDLKICDESFYYRLATEQSLGFGEMYMEGLWDCDRLDLFVEKSISNRLTGTVAKNSLYKIFHYLQFEVLHLQTPSRAWEVAEKHYDLGNDLFKSFLDPSMTYSCGYWKEASNLEEAQQDKMNLIGRKLKLKPGMRVLDIGCGYGSLAKFLAEKYKVQVVGITISKEGVAEAEEFLKDLDVEIRVQDYREVNEIFDRIVCVEMIGHVGPKNYKTFFEVVNRCLKGDGIFLLQAMGIDSDSFFPTEPWFNKHIQANFFLPSHKDIANHVHNLFTIQDWHNFGQDYGKTFMAWYENFTKNWDSISHLFKEHTQFYRMWTLHLLRSVGAFRSGRYHVSQIVLTKEGLIDGNVSVG